MLANAGIRHFPHETRTASRKIRLNLKQSLQKKRKFETLSLLLREFGVLQALS